MDIEHQEATVANLLAKLLLCVAGASVFMSFTFYNGFFVMCMARNNMVYLLLIMVSYPSCDISLVSPQT